MIMQICVISKSILRLHQHPTLKPITFALFIMIIRNITPLALKNETLGMIPIQHQEQIHLVVSPCKGIAGFLYTLLWPFLNRVKLA